MSLSLSRPLLLLLLLLFSLLLLLLLAISRFEQTPKPDPIHPLLPTVPI